VVSVTRFHAGDADNVLPGRATLGGTVRTFDAGIQGAIEAGMRRICDAVALAHDVRISFDFHRGYPQPSMRHKRLLFVGVLRQTLWVRTGCSPT